MIVEGVHRMGLRAKKGRGPLEYELTCCVIAGYSSSHKGRLYFGEIRDAQRKLLETRLSIGGVQSATIQDNGLTCKKTFCSSGECGVGKSLQSQRIQFHKDNRDLQDHDSIEESVQGLFGCRMQIFPMS